jgi:pyrimidine-nucleoside phosphorylase
MKDNFTPYSVIDKKKRGIELTDEEIEYFLSGFLNKEIPDYQMAAFLMAIYFQGMSVHETAKLTDTMLYSGSTIDFGRDDVIDKHSLGGIGDKASFILAPIVAAAGVKVPMIAGRSLGFTGGTVDKIEAIAGFKVDIPLEEFKKRTIEDGLCLIGQTEEIAPADKVVYALRDVTATIDSIPLITASIMSKKLAEGAAGIVMDVKTGNGAFLKETQMAREMSESLMRTAKRFDRKMVCLITDMNQPLGNAVGNSNEIIESIETLKGNGPKDLVELSLELSAHMIEMGGAASSFEEAMTKAKELLDSGAALAELKKMIKNQDGDERVIDDYSILDMSELKLEVLAPTGGYLESFETERIGHLLNDLGGGRKRKKDVIDHGVGFYFHKKIADEVKEGESLVTIYYRDSQKNLVAQMQNIFQNEVIKISQDKVNAPAMIKEKIK